MTKKIRKTIPLIQDQDQVTEEKVLDQDQDQVTKEKVLELETKPIDELSKPKKLGIGKEIVKLLKEGKTPKIVLEEILEKFGSKTTMACVYWYKSKINKGFY